MHDAACSVTDCYQCQLQASAAALKGLEARHSAERLLAEQRAAAERARGAAALSAAEAAGSDARMRCEQLGAALEWMAAEAAALRKGARLPYSEHSGIGTGRRPDATDMLQRWPPVCDAGAGGGACSRGERWLYAHQVAGPWVAARCALADTGEKDRRREEASGACDYRLAVHAHTHQHENLARMYVLEHIKRGTCPLRNVANPIPKMMTMPNAHL
jgi:hypothetical protein